MKQTFRNLPHQLLRFLQRAPLSWILLPTISATTSAMVCYFVFKQNPPVLTTEPKSSPQSIVIAVQYPQANEHWLKDELPIDRSESFQDWNGVRIESDPLFALDEHKKPYVDGAKIFAKCNGNTVFEITAHKNSADEWRTAFTCQGSKYQLARLAQHNISGNSSAFAVSYQIHEIGKD